jgi:hypothetical protein
MYVNIGVFQPAGKGNGGVLSTRNCPSQPTSANTLSVKFEPLSDHGIVVEGIDRRGLSDSLD